MTVVQEYRQDRRVECAELPVGLYDEGRRMPDVAMTDISVSGMGVTVQDRLEEGQVIDYSVVLPGGEVKGRGVVRWVQPYQLGYRSGIEFNKVGFWERRRLGRYIGETFKVNIPPRAKRWFDTLLFIGTVTVASLVLIDMVGLTPTDLKELVVFYIWP